MGLALRLADFFAAQDLEISLANGGFWEATCWAKIFVDCTTLGCCSAAPGLCVRILGVPFVSLLTLGCASLFLHAHPCLPSFSSPTCKQNRSLRLPSSQQGNQLLAYYLIFGSHTQGFGQGARTVCRVSSRFNLATVLVDGRGAFFVKVG